MASAVRSSPSRPTLHGAVLCGDDAKLRGMLESGIDPHEAGHWGMQPLHLAAYNGRRQAARTLLKAGARVNARDYASLTPLHRAVMHGHQGVVRELLQSGARANKPTVDGRTALHVALGGPSSSTTRILQLLLEAGADPCRPDVHGQTPRLMATTLAHRELLGSGWQRRWRLLAWRKADKRCP